MHITETNAELLLNTNDAKALDARIDSYVNSVNKSVVEIADMVRLMRDYEGWRALGFPSFGAWTESKKIGKSTAYQLIEYAYTQEHLEESAVVDATLLTERATRPLAGLPPETQVAIVEQSVAETGSEAKASPMIAKLASEAKAAIKEREMPTIADQVHVIKGLQNALDYLGRVCGKHLKEALSNGTIPLTPKEIIKFSEESEARIKELEPLISVNRWTLAQALDVINTMPTSRHKIERLIWLVQTNPEGVWRGTIDGCEFSVKARTR